MSTASRDPRDDIISGCAFVRALAEALRETQSREVLRSGCQPFQLVELRGGKLFNSIMSNSAQIKTI
jgi:hypothetical protein